MSSLTATLQDQASCCWVESSSDGVHPCKDLRIASTHPYPKGPKYQNIDCLWFLFCISFMVLSHVLHVWLLGPFGLCKLALVLCTSCPRFLVQCNELLHRLLGMASARWPRFAFKRYMSAGQNSCRGILGSYWILIEGVLGCIWGCWPWLM